MLDNNNVVEREFFRPDLATWWIFCLFVAICGAGVSIEFASGFIDTSYTIKTLIPLFIITALIFISIILIADPYKARRNFVLLISFIGGSTIATYLSLLGNGEIDNIVINLLPDGKGLEWSAAIAGPTTEEWSKMLVIILVMLIAYKTLVRPIHGFLVGAFVGLGFQMFENVSYATNSALSNANSDLMGALSTTIMRSLVGISSHWLYSAIIGVGVAILLNRTIHKKSLKKRILLFIAFYLIGYFCHFIWNSPLGSSSIIGSLLIPVKVILWIVILYYVARYALKEEREYLNQVKDKIDLSTFKYDKELLSKAILDRKNRKKFYKVFKKEKGKEELKALKNEQNIYLEMLQETGIIRG
ncbi:PrsW family intramembrane metalloprotease [Oceanivirga miroungae]|uniref:PrsW family intramembrane metalloprotease n=1 Tax=Oceanivirga miroungae TaxID=1130046 RepID=A0A6I8MCY7_9FUSO|nr:PrsW family intramembrane metalloprotease [Oceanivirga miroungae]VWL85001.1 hypothetical protein OMES3154_00273 [Oceanivirga miroungae]